MKIAIDGPSGAGKSEIAEIIAKELGINHVNSGSIYRAFTYYFLQNGIDCNNEKQVKNHFKNCKINLEFENSEQKTMLNGVAVDAFLRAEEISVNSAVISQYKFIREAVVEIQRKFAETENVVIEGRDICSVVLPDADFKFFITASAKSRAERRFKQLINSGANVTQAQVYEDILKRDYYDLHRKFSPLKQTPDSTVLYTDEMTFEEVKNAIVEKIRRG